MTNKKTSSGKERRVGLVALSKRRLERKGARVLPVLQALTFLAK